MLENNLFRKIVYFFILINLFPFLTLANEKKVTLEVSKGKKIYNVKVLNGIPEEKYFKILDWEIGKSKLSDVQSKLGGIISHTGEAAYSTYSLCYAGKDGSVLTFESSEIGGGEHIITSVSLDSLNNFKSNIKIDCEGSEKVSKGLKFGDMVFIQTKYSEIKRKFKTPSKELNDLIVYYFQESITENNKEWDVSAIIEIYQKKNKTRKVVFTKLKTN